MNFRLKNKIRVKNKDIESQIPFDNRMTTSEEIVNMAAFLLSERSGHTTGQLMNVDSGYVYVGRPLANALSF